MRKLIRKKIGILLFAFLIILWSFFGASTAKADAWGTNFEAMGMGKMIDKIQKMIHGVIMGAFKQAAVRTINNSVNNLIAGTTTSGSMFINDWNSYLRLGPRRENALYMNDFFTVTTRGRASGLNYRSNCGQDFGRSNYADYLIENARRRTIAVEIPQVDLQEYVCDAADMFENETWMAFDVFNDKVNNPIAYRLTAQEVQQADETRRREEAKIKAIAYQGYKPQTKGDMVVTPGSTIKDVVSSVKDLPNKMVATAENLPEVITSVVTGIITKTIQQGIGNAQGNIQREIDGKVCDFSRGVYGKLNGLSPEKRFDMPSFSSGSSSSRPYRGMNCRIR